MTTATKITSSRKVDGLPNFDTVQMAQSQTGDYLICPSIFTNNSRTSPSGRRFTVSAKKEVILCAGSINTPQLLQLSGIGNAALLREVGVEPIVELDDVGQHLADHPFLTVQWLVNSTTTSDDISRNATLAAELLQEWQASGTGRYCDPGTNQIAWLRVDKLTEDASAGPAAAQIELLLIVSRPREIRHCILRMSGAQDGFASFVEAAPATGNYFTIANVVSSPFSSKLWAPNVPG